MSLPLRVLFPALACALLLPACDGGSDDDGGGGTPTPTVSYEAKLMANVNPSGFSAPSFDPRDQAWFTPRRLPAVQANGRGEALVYFHRTPGGSGYVELPDGLRLFQITASGLTPVAVSTDFSHASSVYYGAEGLAVFDPQGYDYQPPSGVRTTVPTALTPFTPFNGQQSSGVGYVDASGKVYGWQMTHSTTFIGSFLWTWSAGQSGRRPQDSDGHYLTINPATGDTLYRFVNTYNRASPSGTFEQCPSCGQFGAVLARPGTGKVAPGTLVPGATDRHQVRIVGHTPKGYVVVDVRSGTAAGVAYWQNGTRTPFPSSVTDAFSASSDGDVVVMSGGAVHLMKNDGTLIPLPTATLHRTPYGSVYRYVAAGAGIVIAYQIVDTQGNLAIYRMSPVATPTLRTSRSDAPTARG